jgi:hypothetical protein
MLRIVNVGSPAYVVRYGVLRLLEELQCQKTSNDHALAFVLAARIVMGA